MCAATKKWLTITAINTFVYTYISCSNTFDYRLASNIRALYLRIYSETLVKIHKLLNLSYNKN